MSMRQSSSTVRGPGYALDGMLVGLVLAIVLLGLVMVTSASISKAARDTGDVLFFLKGQLQGAAIGIVLAAALAMIPTELYFKYSNALLVISAVMLVAVLFPGIGHEVNGSRRCTSPASCSSSTSATSRGCPALASPCSMSPHLDCWRS